MGDKAVITDGNQFADESMRLNSAPLSDCHIFLNLDKRSDKGILSYMTTINIRWLHDFDVLAENHIFNTDTDQFWVFHRIFLHCRAKLQGTILRGMAGVNRGDFIPFASSLERRNLCYLTGFYRLGFEV